LETNDRLLLNSLASYVTRNSVSELLSVNPASDGGKFSGLNNSCVIKYMIQTLKKLNYTVVSFDSGRYAISNQIAVFFTGVANYFTITYQKHGFTREF
jgi:uncharacterized membrane protein YoaT (DUF817 family)